MNLIHSKITNHVYEKLENKTHKKVHPALPSMYTARKWWNSCASDVHHDFIIIIVRFDRRFFYHFYYAFSRKNKVPFSMAIGNGELVQHSRMLTARIK